MPADGEIHEHSLSKFIYVIRDKRQHDGQSGARVVPFVPVLRDNWLLHATLRGRFRACDQHHSSKKDIGS
jgi:hypothetical protein